MKQVVAYLRVSTKEQGLGIDAQRAVVRAYCKAQSARIVSEYEEKESGKRDDRPALAKAIADAKKWKATVVVAKLDRLSRDTHFVTGLLKSDVEFFFCDLPQANRMLLHVMASIAEGEREMISQRTKAALAATKARGTLLGGANPKCANNLKPAAQAIGRAKAHKAISAKARAADALIVNDMQTLKAEGRSLKEIADALNARGLTGQRGNPWNAMQVSRTLKRAESP